MQRLGFIHDMLDVKVLVLFVMSRVNYPVSTNRGIVSVHRNTVKYERSCRI